MVLFDTAEKAHPDVFDTLLQVLDNGASSPSRASTRSTARPLRRFIRREVEIRTGRAVLAGDLRGWVEAAIGP